MSTGIGVGVSSAFGGVKASPSFEYSASAFCGNASDPTPTINGTPGGVFTSAPVSPNTGTLVINSSNGRVDLAASDVGNYLVTYTVGGVSESDPFEVLAVQTTGFSYSASSFQQTGTTSPTITGSSGGVFTATIGLSINSSTGVIDLGASTRGGPYTVTYTNTGACQGTPSTFNVSITAAYQSTSSFLFDGINDYFDAGNPTELQFTGAFSVSFWMKSNATGNRAMVSKDNNASNPRAFSIERTNSVSGGYFVVYDGTTAYGVYITSSDSNYVNLNDNNWHNVVGVYTPSTSVSLFVDGNFIKSNTTNIPASVSFVNDNLNIGRRTQGTNYFSGNLNEVSIWNTALSSDAVTEIYNSGAPNDLTSLTNASSSNLKAWYKMGE